MSNVCKISPSVHAVGFKYIDATVFRGCLMVLWYENQLQCCLSSMLIMSICTGTPGGVCPDMFYVKQLRCTKIHDDVMKWKHFPRYWPLMRGIHRSPVDSPHKGQWCRASMFSLICAWTNGWLETPSRSLCRHCNVQSARWVESHWCHNKSILNNLFVIVFMLSLTIKFITIWTNNLTMYFKMKRHSRGLFIHRTTWFQVKSDLFCSWLSKKVCANERKRYVFNVLPLTQTLHNYR